MAHDVDLPDVFPLEDIVVKEEEHRFEVFQGDSGPLPQTEYTIDKAPINRIIEVTGTLNGSTDYTFIQGTDYELSSDKEEILWLNNDRPDAGTIFFITYNTESIISRYVESSEEEFENIDEKIISAVQGKFVGQAEGRELDEIGKLFGQTIGKRRGRTDTQYSIYLQSVVQSFISRGTKTGIKLAISAATDVPVADITINENFDTNEYEVIVIPDTAVKVSLLEEIADIADPSGIDQVRTRFPVSDQMGVDDMAAFTFSDASTTDVMASADATGIFSRRIVDSMASDDAVTIPPKDAATSDTMFADDSNASQQTAVEWESSSWNDMNWATEHN